MAQGALKIITSGVEPQLIAPPPYAEVPTRMYNESDLESYLATEIGTALGERTEMEANWGRWITAYETPFDDQPKKFPFEGAANMTVAVIREAVNTLASAYLQTLLVHRPRWFFKDLMPEWDPFVNPLETFLDLSAERDMKFGEVVREWIIECCKLGTSILEVPWRYEERTIPLHASPNTVEFARRTVRDGPGLWRVPLPDFVIRLFEQDIQEAEWCSKRFRLNERQMRYKYEGSNYRETTKERILERGYDSPEPSDVLEAQEDAESARPSTRPQWEIYQTWVSWRLKGDSAPIELLVDYHRRSSTIMSVRFNPYWHQERPFVPARYWVRPGRFYGEGLCEQLESLQAEITTIRQQRIDNATVANTRMWVRRPMTRGFKPGDKIWPNKIITANNPREDVLPLQAGEIYPSTVASEEIARRDVERLSGANEAQFGAMPVTRTTASAQSQLLTEQAKRFDQTISEFRSGISRVGQITLSMYFQFGAENKAQRWMGDKGRVVAAVFRLPRRASELGLGIEASAPTSRLNRDQRRRNAIELFNLMVQLYERIIPLVGQIAPESAPPVVRELVASAKIFMFEVLEDFERTNPEDILRGLTYLETVLPAAEDLGGLESFERATRDAEVLDRLEGLSLLLREAPRNGDVGVRGRPSGEVIRGISGEQSVL